MTRDFVGIGKAVLGLWTSLEDLSGFLRETPAFMNATAVVDGNCVGKYPLMTLVFES